MRSLFFASLLCASAAFAKTEPHVFPPVTAQEAALTGVAAYPNAEAVVLFRQLRAEFVVDWSYAFSIRLSMEIRTSRHSSTVLAKNLLDLFSAAETHDAQALDLVRR